MKDLGCMFGRGYTAFASVVAGLVLLSLGASNAQAAQTINTASTTSCTAQSGTLIGGNLITDFDNGTFGTGSGAADESPAATDNPYDSPGQIVGGNFDNFYDIDHGDYSFVSNPVTPRNPYQHPEITDPVYGAAGRFFASDPNVSTPTLNFEIFNVVPNDNYELSFWAANSEPNGTPNLVNAVLDGITSYSTGELPAFPAALEWRRHRFIFNAGDRIVIQLAIASTLTGAGGRDFYLDNVELQRCVLAGGTIQGTIFTDTNTNNVYNFGTDGTLKNIAVQLWDTQGDGDASNDIFVSETSSTANGTYEFSNIAASTTYELRVDTTDSDLPDGASIGTPATLGVTVTTGGTTSGHDFGFDLSDAFLEGAKSVIAYQGAYSIPGNDVVYSLSITNRGAGRTDRNTLFMVDELPSDITFYHDDLDGPGGATSDPVLFEQTGANLNFDYARDIAYAAAGPKPANYAACDYTSTIIGYDPAIAYVCFRPRGRMQGGNPNPSFTMSFRAAVK